MRISRRFVSRGVAAPGGTTGAGGEGRIGLTSGLFVDPRKIAKALKRTPGATQQKAFTLVVGFAAVAQRASDSLKDGRDL